MLLQSLQGDILAIISLAISWFYTCFYSVDKETRIRGVNTRSHMERDQHAF